MKGFLKTVACAYKERYSDISRLTFVMPNKRSGTFLLKEFSDLEPDPVLGPRIVPITDFVATICPNVADSRIDLIFRLYTIYLRLPGTDAKITFDKFSSWGETILSDFNEIDMQLADPQEIFKNVYDLNAIKSNFLTEGQKKVMTDYFGYAPDFIEEKFDHLWHNFNFDREDESGNNTPLKKKFRALWQVLLPLYEQLKASLHAEGLTTPGGIYREAAERIKGGFNPYEDDKIVFVGFNALSAAEDGIFSALKERSVNIGNGEEPKADFVWDRIENFFDTNDNPADKYVKDNSSKEKFPMPEWLAEKMEWMGERESQKITVISVPSNILQTKVAGAELKKLVGTIPQMEIEEARVAVVLPDENLLLPLLFALPEEFSNPNLTMGFPLKHTTVISFAFLLKKMHQSVQNMEGKSVFFWSDVKDVLAHPYSRIIFEREEVTKLERYYERERRIMVSTNTLYRLGKEARIIFRKFRENERPMEVIDYLMAILKVLDHKMNGASDESFVRSKVDRVYISTYRDALIRLANCLKEYDLKLSSVEVFGLASRLVAGENVVFEGRPLEGLQIMGVLETRCLDFDTVIMLSMNEKIMPRVGRNSSFIPNIVRLAFGMPPANYQEEIFAYHFFRLIGRSRKAILTYDSRSSENRTPGPSRYLLQMKYLSKTLSVEEREVRFGRLAALHGDILIKKDESLMQQIRRYIEGFETGKPKNLSASALKNYFSCPVKFMYENVLGLRIEKERIESIDAADMGTIVHRTIERLYFPEGKRGYLLSNPILITPGEISALLEENPAQGESKIEFEARRAIMEVHFGMDEKDSARGTLRGSAGILLEYIVTYVKFILEADFKKAPFRLWGSEINKQLNYKLPSGETIRFIMIIDRLDQEGAFGNEEPFRIVDYKTGSAHLKAESFEELFDGTLSAANLFQLIFYAELFVKMIKENPSMLPGRNLYELERKLKMVIYDITKLPTGKGMVSPVIGKKISEKGKEISRNIVNMEDFRIMEMETGVNFRDRLHEIISDISNPDVPFTGHPGESTCKYCDFRLRCELKRAKEEDMESINSRSDLKGIFPIGD